AGRTAITHWAAKAGVLTHCSTQAEVVSILNAAGNPELFTFQSNIRNAMLAATIRTTCHVEFQLLVKLGNALFQLFNQPAGKSFGLCNRQLAELAAGASHCATPERRSRNMKPSGFKAKGYSRRACARHVHNHQVLC